MNRTTHTPDTKTLDLAPDPSTAPPLGGTVEIDTPAPANDNAAGGGIPDTTPLVAHPEVVRCVRAMLRRYRIAPQNMPDAIAEVQAESIETARTRRMPLHLAQWKALTTTIAVHWALDRLREAKVRSKYDAGLCDDADVYLRPTLHWEHRDPVDTKRYLAVLKDLFDSGQMPEHGDEILQGEADEVPHREIAAEIGVSPSVVRGRLFRMRARFRARLAALGMLTLLLLLLFALLSPVGEVAAPAPVTTPEEAAAPACSVRAWDGGAPPLSENRLSPSNEIAP
jgi:DNA-directed RNA polymerase specialized sigma24 family protein